jgi:hypothetical protein
MSSEELLLQTKFKFFVRPLKQLRIVMKTNVQALTRCMNVIYVAGQEGVSRFLLKCIVSIL